MYGGGQFLFSALLEPRSALRAKFHENRPSRWLSRSGRRKLWANPYTNTSGFGDINTWDKDRLVAPVNTHTYTRANRRTVTRSARLLAVPRPRRHRQRVSLTTAMLHTTVHLSKPSQVKFNNQLCGMWVNHLTASPLAQTQPSHQVFCPKVKKFDHNNNYYYYYY